MGCVWADAGVWVVGAGRASERASERGAKRGSQREQAKQAGRQEREVERAVASSLGPGDAGVGVHGHGHGHGWVDLTARKRAGLALADDTYRSGLAGCVVLRAGQGEARQGKEADGKRSFVRS